MGRVKSSSILSNDTCTFNVQDAEEKFSGMQQQYVNAERKDSAREGGGEDIEDQEELEEEEGMLFEEEIEEEMEEEEGMIEGEMSRVVFRRSSPYQEISDVSEQSSKSNNLK